jgi:uncharacterized membrane protein YkgB
LVAGIDAGLPASPVPERGTSEAMYNVFYIIGVIVVVLAILALLGIV